MYKNIFIFYCLLFCFNSCTNVDDGGRSFDQKKLYQKTVFEHDKGSILRLWADDSLIYCSNSPNNKIYTYTFDGDLVRNLGLKGPAPWENGTIWYFYHDDNYYWVHDYPKQMIKKYTYPDEQPIYQTKLITYNNICYIDDDRFLVPRQKEDQSFALSVFDAQLNSFEMDLDLTDIFPGEIIKHKCVSFMLFGNFCQNDSHIVYCCRHAGVFVVIDKNTLEVRKMTDFKKSPIPKAKVKSVVVDLVPNQIVTQSASLSSQKLYTLATNNPENKRKRGKEFYIDMYDLNSGEYLSSYRIPNGNKNKPCYIEVVKSTLIVSFDNGDIVTYKAN